MVMLLNAPWKSKFYGFAYIKYGPGKDQLQAERDEEFRELNYK